MHNAIGITLFAFALTAWSKPNFVVILCDDLGYGDLGCYGSETIATPRIDRMAREGLRLTEFYVAAPICTPTRAAFLTGSYANRTGLPTPLHVYDRIGLPDPIVTLPELLNTAGYRTACYGKWHLGHEPKFYPTRHGFDTYWGTPLGHMFDRKHPTDGSDLFLDQERAIPFPEHGHLTEQITEKAVAFIKTATDPFFLFVSHPMPHVPLAASDRFKGSSKAGLYGDVVETIDWSTGEILDAILQTAQATNTIVVFTSDNGPLTKAGGSTGGLRGEKHDPYEGGMRVPCILWGPGRMPAGVTRDGIATIMDVYPTFASAAGVKPPRDQVLDGRNLEPWLFSADPGASPHEHFFYLIRHGQLAGIRVGDWKLLVRDRRKPIKKLYDLRTDPAESKNLAGQFPDKVAAMQAQIKQGAQDLALPAARPL